MPTRVALQFRQTFAVGLRCGCAVSGRHGSPSLIRLPRTHHETPSPRFVLFFLEKRGSSWFSPCHGHERDSYAHLVAAPAIHNHKPPKYIYRSANYALRPGPHQHQQQSVSRSLDDAAFAPAPTTTTGLFASVKDNNVLRRRRGCSVHLTGFQGQQLSLAPIDTRRRTLNQHSFVLTFPSLSHTPRTPLTLIRRKRILLGLLACLYVGSQI